MVSKSQPQTTSWSQVFNQSLYYISLYNLVVKVLFDKWEYLKLIWVNP